VAIKGKGRTRGRRVVAAPPRPQLVVRKPPLWRRPWLLIVIGVVAAAGILAAVLVGIHSSNAKKLKDREAAALSQLGERFVAQFPADRQLSSGFYFFYPTLSADLDNLASGKLKAKDATAQAQKILDSATKAAAGVGKVSVEKLIPTSFTVSRTGLGGAKGATRAEMLDARSFMQHAFTLYASAASIMKSAVDIPSAPTKTGRREAAAKQKELVATAKQVATEASDLFTQGWALVVSVQTRLGIQAPVA
jgi:hypothetical protein